MCVLCISNSINAQITVENSTPEKITKDILVYYTDGSSNFDLDRLWKFDDTSTRLDYYKAFIGQKILCIKPCDIIYSTCQIMDVEGGEFILQQEINRELFEFPVHKIMTYNMIRPQIVNQSPFDNRESIKWSEDLMNRKGNSLSRYSRNIPYITNDDKSRFFSQFLLIKGAYTMEEAYQIILESIKELLSESVYLPKVQKQIDKLEKKKQKGKIEPNELEMYQNLIKNNKYYKIQCNGKDLYSRYLKGDTLLIGEMPYHSVFLLVEDNKGQEYFISPRDGAGCITEKHLNHIKEQYVSQYVMQMNVLEEPVMKCEDIVLRDQALQAKLKDVKTGEISYATFSYMGSSCYYYSSEEYSREENGAYFFLDNYEIIVPEGL